METAENERSGIWIRRIALLLMTGLLGALGLFLLWRTYPDPAYWRAVAEDAYAYLEAHPWALLLALATLPGIGFPISPLIILASVVLAPRYGMPIACLLIVSSQTVCTIWSYLLAAGPLRGVIEKFVRKRRELPTLTEKNMFRVGVILRMTPGIPFPVQNLALGIMGMRFLPYLIVSVPITALYTSAFVITGGAIFEGHAGLAISGILLLIVLILGTKVIAARRAAV